MAGSIEARLQELGIQLPVAAAPAANYVPFVLSGNQLFVSGQLPVIAGGEKFSGKVGVDIDVDAGQRAAHACALNILAQVKDALGDLDRVEQCLRLGGFVNAPPDFTDHPEVVNGASNLIADVFGAKGKHARFAVGCGSLPHNVPVEVDATFAIS